MKRKITPKYPIIISLLLIAAMLAGSLQVSQFEVQAADGQESGTAETDSRFNHPGLLHTQPGFDKMKENVEDNVSPVRETWDSLCENTYSNAGWTPRPLEEVIRGGNGDNINQLRIDIRRAYQNALIWKINGDEAHGEAASRIINAWTSDMKQLSGNADRFLAAGLQGYELANIGEMMRDYPGFDTEGLQSLLLNVFYPMNDDFMIRHNDAYIGNYWANWELANIASMISIGVYCDREDIYDRALNYFKTGKGNGSFYHAMPYVFDDNGTELVQWQESVRDQGHTTLGIVLCGVICETAWNQGDDLYSLSDNRFMKAVEYTVKYNSLNQDVPSAAYEYRQGQKGTSKWHDGINPYQRGNWRPIYYQMYNHYVNRKGLEMPCMEQMIENTEGTYIEGAAGNSLDELGWYSLTYAGLDTRVEDVPIEGDLTDGVYRILSASSGKSLVVNEEGNLASAEKGAREDEWWLVKNRGDGEYTITNLKTGKLMQVNGDDYYSYGTQIGTGEPDGSRAQRFAFLSEDDGSFRMVPSLNFLVLALENNSTEDDARIIQWRNDAEGSYWNSSNPGQRWKAEKEEQISQLTNKIAEAEAIEQGNYTDESFALLQTALEKAREAVKFIDNKEGMTVAVSELQHAIDNLKERTSDGSGTGSGNGTGSGSETESGNGTGSGNGTESVIGNEDTAKKLKDITTVKAVQQSARRYVTVSFEAIDGAASYDIYRSTKAQSGYKKIGTVTGTSFVDKKVSAAKTYYYKVMAISQTAGCSSALSSGYAKVKVLAVPSVKVKQETGRKVKVSWKKVKGANGYEVYTSAKKIKGYKKVKTLKKGNKVKVVLTRKKNVKKLYVKVRPYYMENGRKMIGTFSKEVIY